MTALPFSKITIAVLPQGHDLQIHGLTAMITEPVIKFPPVEQASDTIRKCFVTPVTVTPPVGSLSGS